ncbi:PHD finger protein 14-like isoform X2 [Ptychodera flava]|uniref:PHD finger protein 14-like isoform X2 n=1 Tax=Ptychodera flava TaxID=63121 RepID=UPI003969E35D
MSSKKSISNAAGDDVDDGVGFLYKTMLSRDPKKRRIKPVEKHLIQVAFGDDSEDDSDFDIKEHNDEDEEDISGISDNESDDNDKDNSSSADSESDDEDDDDEDEEDEEKDEVTIEELVDKAKSKQQQIKSSSREGKHYDKMKVLICSVCLGDHSDDDDEIIECDNCGIPVHEGCYGASDTDSTQSNQTSSSTEPWFCDACKAGISQAMCEMCPNNGGIFKETDTGRWVHVVCSLYIPGVTFGDVDKLSPVVLSEVQYSKWGARECCYCEDERFAKTGIVIGCDAGMCRNYFHVTCAQRVGLLSEASPDEDIADPFYAYCKLHVDKQTMKQKRQHWLAVQSHCKHHKLEQIEDEILKTRILDKLEQSKVRYNESRKKRQPPWVPTEKIPRLLSTCPSACRRLMKKAELLGINTETVSSRSATERRDQRGKWRMAPAFNPEFVNYYLERNVKITNMKVRLDGLMEQSEKLHLEQQTLRKQYDTLSSDIETLKMTNTKLTMTGEELWKKLSELGNKKFPLPPVLKPAQKTKKSSPTRKETPKSPTLAVIHLCGICNKSTDQHLLALCDTCKKYYHLGCLDPPLTRMPKKTTYSGWQCSECCSSDSDSSTAPPAAVEATTPEGDKTRRSRRQIREPNKFTPIQALYIDVKKLKASKKRKYKRGMKVKRKLDPEDEEDDDVVTLPPAKRERRKPAPRKPKEIDIRTQCATCEREGDNSTLVRCDECKKCYHFGCLDPPCKKSPKQAGYMWLCEECDSTPTDESEEDDNQRKKSDSDDDKTSVKTEPVEHEDDDDDDEDYEDENDDEDDEDDDDE